jgi:hypothetical protein
MSGPESGIVESLVSVEFTFFVCDFTWGFGDIRIGESQVGPCNRC